MNCWSNPPRCPYNLITSQHFISYMRLELEVSGMGQYKRLDLSWLKAGIFSFQSDPLWFSQHRDQRLSRCNSHFKMLPSCPAPPLSRTALPRWLRIFVRLIRLSSSFPAVILDMTLTSLLARSCSVLHTESQICLLSSYRRRRTHFPAIRLMFNFPVKTHPRVPMIDAKYYNQSWSYAVCRHGAPDALFAHTTLRTEDGPTECSEPSRDVQSRFKRESHKYESLTSRWTTAVANALSTNIFKRRRHNKAAFNYSDTHHTNSQ
jgi:hypothetical protein